ncbi:hypothetical protein MODO_0274 [Myroides odoratimimus]|nr:hypothetical protein MODO_0274 [Myroides odoratimimus]
MFNIRGAKNSCVVKCESTKGLVVRPMKSFPSAGELFCYYILICIGLYYDI